jgi:hypothetical protein
MPAPPRTSDPEVTLWIALEANLITARRKTDAMAAPKASALGLSKEAEEFLRDNPSARKIARAAVEDYVRQMKALNEFSKHSTMTEAEAIEIGRAWRRDIHKRITSE